MSVRRWKIGETDARTEKMLKESLGVTGLAARAMAARGVRTAEEAALCIGDGAVCEDPFVLTDMRKAVDRILLALDRDEVIAVFGDYDVDGLTATTLMYRCLSSLGAQVVCSLPSRDDTGYGLSREAIDSLAGVGTTLIVTVDNGVSAFNEVAYAASVGIDTVITDHHVVRDEVPAAVAVVNPHRADDGSPFRELAGVGVALKLAAALEGVTVSEAVEEYGLLAAIGTIADIMPLYGENRTIVRRGLAQFPSCNVEGLRALCEQAGLDLNDADESSVSYVISPHLNAAGRMGNAELALSLLLHEEPEKVKALAEELGKINEQRRERETESVAVINGFLEKDPSLLSKPVIIVSGDGFHSGVMGIVCSRLVEQYNKPVIIISEDGEDAKGSGRSVEGISLFDIIENCADLMEKFGGHEMAAGFTMNVSRLPEFRRRVEEYCHEHADGYRLPCLQVDGVVEPREVTEESVAGLRVLAPFGCQNKEPCFLIRNAVVAGIYRLGSGRNSRLMFKKGQDQFYAACFGIDPDDFAYPVGSRVDVVMNYSVYNGHNRSMVSARLVDIRSSEFTESDIASYEQYRRLRFSGKATDASLIRVDRSDAAAVYRRVRAEKLRLSDDAALAGKFGSLPLGKVFVLLDTFMELGLFEVSTAGGYKRLGVVPNAPKRDLMESSLYRQLCGEERNDG